MARVAGNQSQGMKVVAGNRSRGKATLSSSPDSYKKKKVSKSDKKRPCDGRKLSSSEASAKRCKKGLPGSPAKEESESQAQIALADLNSIVVNLDRRPDRMEGCAKRMDAFCGSLPRERFPATDGKLTPISAAEVTESWHTGRNVEYQKIRAARKGWSDLDTYQVRTLALSPGERGCAMSHIRAWRRCLELAEDSERPLLVLEDDAAPTADFVPILTRALGALPRDAHLLYLGYSQAADWRREVSADLVEAEYVWTTVAYIIWPAGARLLLGQLPVNEPVDNWMAAASASGSIKSYCVRPKIVHQADAWNVNSDVAHSDEHYWGPCSDIHHSDSFYWGPDDPRGAPDRLGASGASGSSFWDVGSEDSDESAKGS